MPLPRAVARFNKRYTNRLIEPLARRRGGFAVVHHVGRRSGVSRTTPVNAFPLDETVVIALTYGPDADWFQNCMAGDGAIESQGERRVIVGCELIGRDEAWPALPGFVRLVLRVLSVRDFCRLTLA